MYMKDEEWKYKEWMNEWKYKECEESEWSWEGVWEGI